MNESCCEQAEERMPLLLLIILVFVIFYGGNRLGDIGKGLGEGIRNFRDAMKDEKSIDKEKPPNPPS